MHCDTSRTAKAYGSPDPRDEVRAPPLSERHLRELRDKSAILGDVVAERGCWTATTPAELVAIGFDPEYQVRVPALVFPLHGVDGSNGRYSIKPDNPRTDKNGRVVKYDFKVGLKPILDVPPRCLEALQDPTVPLHFTEGAKKSDCLAGLGYCAVNIWGVHNWYRNPEHGGFATIEPLEDWDRIPLDGRVCYLDFDSDAFSKPQVGLALRRLANFLTRRGALVYIVKLADAPDGNKDGVDDLVAREGAEAFAERVANAEPWGSQVMVRHLQTRVRELELQLSAQAAVLRNADLSATQKVVAIATVHEAGWAVSANKPTPFKVNYGVLARAAGVSAQSVSSAIKVLSEPSGLFVQHHTREATEEGQWRSIVRLEPRREGGVVALLRATAEYKPPDRPSWGGKRTPRCPDHPFADVAKRSTLTCVDCGQLIGDPVLTILKCQDDNSDELGDIVDRLDDRADLLADASTTDEVLNDQLDISDLNPPNPGNDESPATPGTTDDQVDNSDGCTECGRPLYPGVYDRGVCDPCAQDALAVPS